MRWRHSDFEDDGDEPGEVGEAFYDPDGFVDGDVVDACFFSEFPAECFGVAFAIVYFAPWWAPKCAAFVGLTYQEY